MKIAINTLAMKSYKHGMGRYIGNLVDGLLAGDLKNQYLLYVSNLNAKHFNVWGNDRVKLKFVTANRPLRIFWEQVVLPWDLKREKVDIFLGPAFTVPLLKTSRQVVAILDLTWFKHPEKHLWAKQLYFRKMIPFAARRAEKIITISRSTKIDLVEILGVPEEEIVVTHLASDPKFCVIKDKKKLNNVAERYRLPSQFILFVGVLEPRKNIEGLIRAYAELKRRVNLPHKLVIGGGRSYGWKNREIFRLVEDLGLGDEVIFSDFIVEEDLSAVYNLADLFVLPSLYEGFGLPILEAQACGCPVITSNLSSMPEVGGDGTYLVDPYDTEKLVTAMITVLTDDKQRGRMISKGFENVKQFSWKKTAQKTLEVFEQVYGCV